MVEHGTENAGVDSSSLSLGTTVSISCQSPIWVCINDQGHWPFPLPMFTPLLPHINPDAFMPSGRLYPRPLSSSPDFLDVIVDADALPKGILSKDPVHAVHRMLTFSASLNEQAIVGGCHFYFHVVIQPETFPQVLGDGNLASLGYSHDYHRIGRCEV